MIEGRLETMSPGHEVQTIQGCQDAQNRCREKSSKWYQLVIGALFGVTISLFGFSTWNAATNARQDNQISVNTLKLLGIETKIDRMYEILMKQHESIMK